MPPSILSLFTGYGGLDMAVESITGGHVVAVSDIDSGPCTLLEVRRPGVPNLGDITTLDWDSPDVPQFDVLAGGYPCQPFSAAGRRMGEKDPRHLWPHVLEAIRTRRPSQVFLENVRGHLSLGFAQVLRDLAQAQYAVRWSIVAASTVGAPHRRERLYIYAVPSPDPVDASGVPDKPATAGEVTAGGYVTMDRMDKGVDAAHLLLPTPMARDHRGKSAAGRDGGKCLGDAPTLFPSPCANDSKGSRTAYRPRGNQLRDLPVLLSTHGSANHFPTPTAADADKARSNPSQAKRNSPPLAALPILLPTPQANLGSNGGGQHPDKRRAGGHSISIEDAALGMGLDTPYAADHWDTFNTPAWGKYAAAVARWALITGNPAPAPVEPNSNGRPRLTAAFPEWMMGLPAGYLTGEDVGLSRTQAVKLAGNGVVPQAAAWAFTALTSY